jgi:DNA-binding NarL/FixJ family response regulator
MSAYDVSNLTHEHAHNLGLLEELERRMSAVEQRLAAVETADRSSTPAAQEKTERTRSPSTTRPKRPSTMERVIELQRQGLKQNQIAQQLGIHKSNVSRALRKAKERERIESQRANAKEVAMYAAIGNPLRNWFKYERNF